MNYVIANSGNTSFIFYIDNDNGSDPGWFVATYWVLGSGGSALFLNVYEGVSNPIGRVFYMTQSGFEEHHSNQLMSKPNSSEYSPFTTKLHLSSAETLYFENRQVDTGGTYDNILSTWGSLIFVGAYDMLKDVTQPYDCPICPLYVDSSSTDSGKTLAFPEVIDEPTDGSIIHNGEVADHKITLVYDEYKVSYYCGGSHAWIVGLTVTPNSGGSGVQVVSDLSEITNPTEGMRAVIKKGSAMTMVGFRFTVNPNINTTDIGLHIYDDSYGQDWGEIHFGGNENVFGYRTQYQDMVYANQPEHGYYSNPKWYFNCDYTNKVFEILFPAYKLASMRYVISNPNNVTGETVTSTAVCPYDMYFTYHETPIVSLTCSSITFDVTDMDKSDYCVAAQTTANTQDYSLQYWNQYGNLGRYEYGDFRFRNDNLWRVWTSNFGNIYTRRSGNTLTVAFSYNPTITFDNLAQGVVATTGTTTVTIENGWEPDIFDIEWFEDVHLDYETYKECLKATYADFFVKSPFRAIDVRSQNEIIKRWSLSRSQLNNEVYFPVNAYYIEHGVSMLTYTPDRDDTSAIQPKIFRIQWAPEASSDGFYFRIH